MCSSEHVFSDAGSVAWDLAEVIENRGVSVTNLGSDVAEGMTLAVELEYEVFIHGL
jgi:hypothetical protein